MDRRRFLLTSLAGVVAEPLAAEAQPAARVPQVGVLRRRIATRSTVSSHHDTGIQPTACWAAGADQRQRAAVGWST
jgi:hypothetical protein